MDAHFMEKRRNLNDGVSEGKLAGALYYRLTRAKIISLAPDVFDEDKFVDFQERVMIRLVTDLLHVRLDHPWIKQLAGTQRGGGLRSEFQNISGELIYLTSKRHYNQESLALFFDTMVYLAQILKAHEDALRTIQDLQKLCGSQGGLSS
jgi:hypothetical protein